MTPRRIQLKRTKKARPKPINRKAMIVAATFIVSRLDDEGMKLLGRKTVDDWIEFVYSEKFRKGKKR